MPRVVEHRSCGANRWKIAEQVNPNSDGHSQTIKLKFIFVVGQILKRLRSRLLIIIYLFIVWDNAG